MNRVFTLTLILTFSVLAPLAADKVIDAGAKHSGDLRIKKGNLKIGAAADVAGNIFIEEGDLFIANTVDIMGSITITTITTVFATSCSFAFLIEIIGRFALFTSSRNDRWASIDFSVYPYVQT